MKVEPYSVCGTVLGIEIRLTDRRCVRLHLKDGCITLRIEQDGSLAVSLDQGTLAVKPHAANAVNLRIDR